MPYDPTKDPLKDYAKSSVSFGGKGYLVVPDDNADLPTYPKTVRANTAGNVVFIPKGNDDASPITIAVAAGECIPWQVRRVKATGTSAILHASHD